MKRGSSEGTPLDAEGLVPIISWLQQADKETAAKQERTNATQAAPQIAPSAAKSDGNKKARVSFSQTAKLPPNLRRPPTWLAGWPDALSPALYFFWFTVWGLTTLRPDTWGIGRNERPVEAPAHTVAASSLPPPSTRPVKATSQPAMIRIPAGQFQMGSAQGERDETPVHPERLASFWIDQTEVTGAAYKACLDAGECSRPGVGGACNWEVSGREQHPVNCIDWMQAQKFCSFLGARLPSEAEWEYAARGKSSASYPWGAALPKTQPCWRRADSQGTCKAGGSAQDRSSFGVLDLGGNVLEWTADPYRPCLSKHCRVIPEQRSVRGGSWYGASPETLRAADRGSFSTATRSAHLGFRCARSG